MPTGTTLLEASAGTGKTHTVGALVCRYVAEGVATLDQVLVITFGRAASRELRERVREHLVAAARALTDPATARAGADPVLALLAGGDGADPAEVRRRQRRLATALADFDAATIATTHQFCQQVLTGLGVAGDSEPGTELVDDLDDLVVQVVDDLYVRAFGRPGAEPPIFDRARAVELGRKVVDDPQAVLVPDDADPGTPAARQVRFTAAVRQEVDRRKRALGILGYDDLLARVAEALGPADAAARQRMRSRWTVVLVDEFQDTDPVQWEVLRLAFDGHATLVLIGDPKQAIYAFRGGDVDAYLAAAATASSTATLSENHRSDAPLVRALQVLMGGAALGDHRIVVRPVTAARPARLTGAPVAAPVRLRVVRRDQVGRRSGPGPIPVDAARRFVAVDLAGDIARLLTSRARFADDPLTAGQVAVLVATHKQAALARDALRDAGIPAVVAGAGSVYATPAAGDWLVLLEALEQPHRSGRVRAAALTAFLGRTATDLDEGGEALSDELGTRLRGWAALVEARGVAVLLELAGAQTALTPRLLATAGGERLLTDLRHIGQELHEVAGRDRMGLPGIVEWLRRRRREAGGDTSADRTRRLDSDAAAVQILTLHASKGLQFPVVYVPFAFDRWVPTPDLLLLHDDTGIRQLDVGGPGASGRADRIRRASGEASGEALRLLYVGLTRAQSQVVTWWAPTTNTSESGLHRLLLGRSVDGGVVPDTTALPTDDAAADRFAALAAQGALVVEPATAQDAPAVQVVAPRSTPLTLARFTRDIDVHWRRTSYSALTAPAAAAGPGVGSEHETPDIADRSDEAGVDTVPDDEAGRPPVPLRPAEADDISSPMRDLPIGAAFGTLVHAVLETVDPRADDLAAEVLARCVTEVGNRPVGVAAPELAAALLPVLTTPLGPLAGQVALADIGLADRLAEVDFELPLGGGDDPRGAVRLADLAPVLRRHLPAGDPLAPYADRLTAPELGDQLLSGYLTGSLDAVLRLPGPRYLVADYKTNWLGEMDGPPLSAHDYRPDAVAEAMLHSHYPLQALLYSVVLHRFLRWRQPGYDPAVHLGGVLYLFVRGMCGPDTPVVDDVPCGVFSWLPPPALIVELSDLLDGDGLLGGAGRVPDVARAGRR
nr:UvrD-helicase domain-containing protein [Nakamurella flavida]